MTGAQKLPLGLIEGFYGQPWSWGMRADYARFLSQNGYSFYLYAPKADSYLRRKWRDPFPQEHFYRLSELRTRYLEAGVQFGVGFTPFELHHDLSGENLKKLNERLELFNRMELDFLAILLDDMKGGIPGLAQIQADLVHRIRNASNARKLIFCPTYYSSDPILDQLFGQREVDYLEQLGRRLDPSIGVFWTGEAICSTEYSRDHLQKVSEALGRKIFLWDNYPVNDGPKMCKFLHLSAVSGRPAQNAEVLEAHAVNPMNQPLLSRIPLLTLASNYRDEDRYDPRSAWRQAALQVAAPSFVDQLEHDLKTFHHQGLDALSEGERKVLIAIYQGLPDEVSAEVLHWLEGRSVVTRDVFLTQ